MPSITWMDHLDVWFSSINKVLKGERIFLFTFLSFFLFVGSNLSKSNFDRRFQISCTIFFFFFDSYISSFLYHIKLSCSITLDFEWFLFFFQNHMSFKTKAHHIIFKIELHKKVLENEYREKFKPKRK